jgi:hypothetical protein
METVSMETVPNLAQIFVIGIPGKGYADKDFLSAFAGGDWA